MVGINDIEIAFSFGSKILKATKKSKKLHDDIAVIIYTTSLKTKNLRKNQKLFRRSSNCIKNENDLFTMTAAFQQPCIFSMKCHTFSNESCYNFIIRFFGGFERFLQCFFNYNCMIISQIFEHFIGA